MSVKDWQQIREVLNGYCSAIDRLDFEMLRQCFHPGAVADYRGFVGGSVDDIIAYVEGPEGAAGLERTMHYLANTSIEIGAGSAHTEAYGLAYHFGPADHAWCRGCVVIGLRYIDRFEKRSGDWRIAQRTVIHEWGRNESTGEWMSFAPELLGSRDRNDARYAR